MRALFEELKPFYEQLHAFVRRRLKQQYGDSVFPASGHIPAHLLGQCAASAPSLQAYRIGHGYDDDDNNNNNNNNNKYNLYSAV